MLTKTYSHSALDVVVVVVVDVN